MCKERFTIQNTNHNRDRVVQPCLGWSDKMECNSLESKDEQGLKGGFGSPGKVDSISLGRKEKEENQVCIIGVWAAFQDMTKYLYT